MASKNSPNESGKTENRKSWLPLAVAAIGATATVVVGYWQFHPKDNKPSGKDFVGRILDAKTEQKIRGAKISLEADGAPPVIYTDSEGVFSFPLKNSDTPVRIRVEVDGYEKFDRRVKPSSKADMEEVRLAPVSLEDAKKKLK